MTSGRAAGRHTGSQLTVQTAADAESYLNEQLLLPLSVQPEDRLEPEFTERKRTGSFTLSPVTCVEMTPYSHQCPLQ